MVNSQPMISGNANAAGGPKNQFKGKSYSTNPDGSPSVSVKKQAAQADSTATDVAGLKTDLNALLAKLRSAGILS